MTNDLVAGFGYNRNDADRPSGNNMQGDCAIRAIAVVSGKSYTEIEKRFRKWYRGRGISTIVVRSVLRELGWTYVQTSSSSADRDTTTLTTLDALDLKKDGAYVLELEGHVVAVVDGTFQDTWDSRYDDQRGGTKLAQIRGYHRKTIPQDDEDYDDLISGFVWRKTTFSGYALTGTKKGKHDEVVEAIQTCLHTTYAEAIQLVIEKQKQLGVANPLNYLNGTAREVWTSILEENGWQFTKIGKRGQNLATIEFKKNKHNRRMMIETHDRVIATNGRKWYDRLDSRRNLRDGFSSSAPIDDFRNTSNPTRRPKTVVVQGYWTPPICHCFSDAESNTLNG